MFGKLSGPDRLRPSPDDDGITRAIPKAIWDGPHGKMLSELGMSPDDPANLMPTPELMSARADAVFAEQERFLAALNKQLPDGLEVIPWAMIPWSCWSGPQAAFLMVTCHYFPAHPWNSFMLAANERTSQALGLPVHPRAALPGYDEGANEALAEFRDEYQVEYDAVAVRLEQGDIAALDDHEKAVMRAQGKVRAAAAALAGIAFGEDVYYRHLELFGKTLGWHYVDELLANRDQPTLN